MTGPRREGERGWDPFGELQALRAELGRLVGSALVGGRGGGSSDVDLMETRDGWRVVARLPGVAPEEVAVEVDERELCIRARSEEEVNADYGLGAVGSRARGFEYRVNLPAPVDPGKVDALMDHGLLTVTLPRRDRPGRRTIPVSRGRYVADEYVPDEYVSDEYVPDESHGEPARAAALADPAADRELHRPDTVAPDADRPPR